MTRPYLAPLAFGGAPIGDLYYAVPERQAIATVERALEHGFTLFDTAPYYGFGLSEERIGRALRGVDRHRFTLSSKVGRVLDGRKARFDFSRDGILRSFESSLARLGVDRIDIVHLHDPDDHEDQASGQALETLVDLKHQGLIGAIGIGMNSYPMIERFVDRGAVNTLLLAGRHTLLEQGAARFLEKCRAKAVPVLLAGVFNSGILANGAVDGATFQYAPAEPAVMERVRAIARICAAHGVPLPAAALQFCGRHPAVSELVVGAATPDEIDADVAYYAAPIAPELWDDLAAAGLLSTDAVAAMAA